MQKIQWKLFVPLLIVMSALMTGCSKSSEKITDASINQTQICEAKTWQSDATASVCKPGQKVVFLPASFGNEQLPILFAALNCDLRYSVAMTNGGVTCIYVPVKPAEEEKNLQGTVKPSPKP